MFHLTTLSTATILYLQCWMKEIQVSATAGIIRTGENQSTWTHNRLECRFVYHVSHINCPGIKPRPLGDMPMTNHLNHDTVVRHIVQTFSYSLLVAVQTLSV